MFVTEAELCQLVAPYGQVTRTLIMNDKNQAFIQMDSIESASKVLAGAESFPPSIRTKAVYLQFSSRQEINTPQSQAGGMGGQIEPFPGKGDACCVLILAISNVTIPVTIENIRDICKPHGDVQKVIMFAKAADFQVLVQMGTVDQASRALSFLDGKDLFQGCCHLRVAFSKRQSLVVKENSAKSRDFTQGVPSYPQMGQMGGSLIHSSILGMNPMNPQGMPGMGGMGGMPMFDPSGGRSPVVLVSKLEPTSTTPEMLFQLFGVYGDVLRIKILYNKRDTALIQFASGQQAETARQNLNGVSLLGSQLQVASSKHSEVKLPREEEGKDLTRDFSGSELHRFRKKTVVSSKNVNPPSAVLHVANIHESVTDEELKALFTPYRADGQPPQVEFFQNNRSMAYVAMGSVEEGVSALISVHSFRLHEYPLRVSFSHKDPSTMGGLPRVL